HQCYFSNLDPHVLLSSSSLQVIPPITLSYLKQKVVDCQNLWVAFPWVNQHLLSHLQGWVELPYPLPVVGRTSHSGFQTMVSLHLSHFPELVYCFLDYL